MSDSSHSPESALERALDYWRQWSAPLAERPRPVRPLTGGLTNRTWLVSTSAGPAAVRLNSPAEVLLGVDRHREAVMLEAAAAAGLAPPVWRNDWRRGYLVTAFIDGGQWRETDFESPARRRALAGVIERLQALDIDLPRFNYLAHLDAYWRHIRERDIHPPLELASRWRQWRPAIARFQSADWQAVPCHHDLSPANILETGAQLYLIDWEYGALGHPAVDPCALDAGASAPEVVKVIVALMDGFWSLLREASSPSPG